jgi:hypothetical protein
MGQTFEFSRYLLIWMAAVVAVSAVATYKLEAWGLFMAIGFILMGLGGVLGRIRVGDLSNMSFPAATQLEGSVAATGVALWCGVAVALAAHKLAWL